MQQELLSLQGTLPGAATPQDHTADAPFLLDRQISKSQPPTPVNHVQEAVSPLS